jgi:hypothetical protein
MSQIDMSSNRIITEQEILSNQEFELHKPLVSKTLLH